MAFQPETATWDAGVYQLETTDPVQGGVGGKSNSPLLNLANRTAYLKQHVDNLENGTTIPTGVATLASPTFTGDPKAPTAALGDDDTSIANTAFVQDTVGGYLSKSVAGGSNVTLTAVEAGRGILAFTGVLTANISVILPATPTRSWIVRNYTTGAFTLTVKTASGGGVVVTRGYTTFLYSNGTDILDGKTDFNAVRLFGNTTIGGDVSGGQGYAIALQGSLSIFHDVGGTSLAQTKETTDFSSPVWSFILNNSETTTGTKYPQGLQAVVRQKVAAGVSNPGYARGVLSQVFRNAIGTGDDGTMAAIYGHSILFGHFNTDAASNPQSTVATGLYVNPYAMTGKINTLHGVWVTAPALGGTLSDAAYGVRLQLGTTSATNAYNLFADGSAPNYMAGSLGIGTTDPGSILDVTGFGGILVSASKTDASGKTGRIKFQHYYNAEEPFSGLLGVSGSTGNTLYIGGGSDAENAASEIRFYIAANGTTLSGTQIGTIGPNGWNVGGTSTNTARLQISGDDSNSLLLAAIEGVSGNIARLRVYVDDTDGVTFNSTNTSGAKGFKFTHGSSTTPSVTISSTGNVGIGATSPTRALTVFEFSDTVTPVTRFGQYNAASTDNHFLEIEADVANNLVNLVSTGTSAGGFVFRSGAVERMKISGTAIYVGADTTVNLADLRSYTRTTNGYQKLPSGLIIQWGLVTTSASAGVSVTFPIAFPGSLLSVTMAPLQGSSVLATYSNQTASGMTVHGWNPATGARVAFNGVSWLAIGY